MRITVDINEDVLESIVEITGETRKSPALAKALEEFVKRTKAREFGKRIREGAFDYPLSREEMAELDK